MHFQVDEPSRRVVCGDRRWPFAVDCRDDSAAIDLDGTAYRVRPLRWREKRTLARFARLGESFLKAEFVRLSLAEPDPPPPDGEGLDVLFALALWFNAPGEEGPALPFEPRALARVTFDLCRVLGRPPGDFDARDASEVEWLWEAAQAGQASATPAGPAAPSDSGVEAARTTILVVPDPDPDPADRTPSEPAPPPAGSARPDSALDTPSRRSGEPSTPPAGSPSPDPAPLAALAPERAVARPESPRPDRFRVTTPEPPRPPAAANGAGRTSLLREGARPADRGPAPQGVPREVPTGDAPAEAPVSGRAAEAPAEVLPQRSPRGADLVGAPAEGSSVSLRALADARPPRATREDSARAPWALGAASFRPEAPAGPGLDEFADELIRAASLLGIDVED